MEWKDVKVPDDLWVWATEKAGSPAALQAFWNCMHHFLGYMEPILETTRLENPMSMGNGSSQITSPDGKVTYYYLLTFTLEDTKQSFTYLMEMIPGSDQYCDAKYGGPEVENTQYFQ